MNCIHIAHSVRIAKLDLELVKQRPKSDVAANGGWPISRGGLRGGHQQYASSTAGVSADYGDEVAFAYQLQQRRRSQWPASGSNHHHTSNGRNGTDGGYDQESASDAEADGNWNCNECGTSLSPWLCLFCGLIHCGRYVNQDGLKHYKNYRDHCVSMDCHSYAVFCYYCDDFVGNDTNDRRLSAVRDSLRYYNDIRCSDHSYFSLRFTVASSAHRHPPPPSLLVPPPRLTSSSVMMKRRMLVSSASTRHSMYVSTPPVKPVIVDVSAANGRLQYHRQYQHQQQTITTIGSGGGGYSTNHRRQQPPQLYRSTPPPPRLVSSSLLQHQQHQQQRLFRRDADLSGVVVDESEEDDVEEEEAVVVVDRTTTWSTPTTPSSARSPSTSNSSDEGVVVVSGGEVAATTSETTTSKLASSFVPSTKVVTVTQSVSVTKAELSETSASATTTTASTQSTTAAAGVATRSNRRRKLVETTAKENKLRRIDQLKPLPSRIRTETTQSLISTDSLTSLKGLRNLGNTCFMNAVLQSLNNIDEFCGYFRSLPAIVTHSIDHVPRYNTRRSQGQTGGVLAEELRKTLVELSGESTTAISPESLFSVVWKLVPRFRGFQQQDAHEFLRCILDRLHSELGDRRPETTTNNDDDDAGAGAGATAAASVVTRLFQGLLQSQVTCLLCGTPSRKQDPFLDLSLDVPVIPKCDAAKKLTIADCLERFFAKEELDSHELYWCEKCRHKRRSTKQFFIRRLPNVLCLHMKRFRWSHSDRRKVDSFVEFPMTNLDMRQFLLPSLPKSKKLECCEYDLAATVVHHGSGVTSGHYTACARRQGRWYQFNDATVRAYANDVGVAAQNAYLLFYVRRCRADAAHTHHR